MSSDTPPTSSSPASSGLKIKLRPGLSVAMPSDTPPTSSSPAGSGLKIKLRCIQAALREPFQDVHVSSPSSKRDSAEIAAYDEDDTDSEIELFPSKPRIKKATSPITKKEVERSSGRKRNSAEIVAYDEDDTDSEIELFPSKPRIKKATSPITKKEVKRSSCVKTKQAVDPIATKEAKHASPIKTKKMKTTHLDSTQDDDAVFDASDEEESPEDKAGPQLSLVTPVMKRNERIVDPKKPEHAKLIAEATKVGADYYDSEADDLPGDVKDSSKPHLFRNVKWGAYATDFSNINDFAKEPEFTQFVPGRFELLPDGNVVDQKIKLIIKLVDKTGRQRIFANPPPRDWHSQEAITALNKRTVQQIRRNTNVRFREVVRAYVPEERRWILANLTAGKPTKGWKVFVEEFNRRFEGKSVEGVAGTRPFRSHSSLTKEVERFGPQFYLKGQVPVPAKKGKKE